MPDNSTWACGECLVQTTSSSHAVSDYPQIDTINEFVYTAIQSRFLSYFYVEVALYTCTVACNFVTLGIIVTNRNLRILSNAFFATLSACDLGQGLIGLGFNIMRIYGLHTGDWTAMNNKILIGFLQYFWWFATGLSISSLVMISLERWLYIARPFFAQRVMNLKIIAVCLFALVIICLAGSAVAVNGDFASANVSYLFPIMHTFISAVIILIYSHIILITFRQLRAIAEIERIGQNLRSAQNQLPPSKEVTQDRMVRSQHQEGVSSLRDNVDTLDRQDVRCRAAAQSSALPKPLGSSETAMIGVIPQVSVISTPTGATAASEITAIPPTTSKVGALSNANPTTITEERTLRALPATQEPRTTETTTITEMPPPRTSSVSDMSIVSEKELTPGMLTTSPKKTAKEEIGTKDKDRKAIQTTSTQSLSGPREEDISRIQAKPTMPNKMPDDTSPIFTTGLAHTSSHIPERASQNRACSDSFNKVQQSRTTPNCEPERPRPLQAPVRKNWRVVKRAVIVFAMYFLTVSPWTYFSALQNIISDTVDKGEVAQALITFSCVHYFSNFFVYASQNRDFRAVLCGYLARFRRPFRSGSVSPHTT